MRNPGSHLGTFLHFYRVATACRLRPNKLTLVIVAVVRSPAAGGPRSPVNHPRIAVVWSRVQSVVSTRRPLDPPSCRASARARSPWPGKEGTCQECSGYLGEPLWCPPRWVASLRAEHQDSLTPTKYIVKNEPLGKNLGDEEGDRRDEKRATE